VFSLEQLVEWDSNSFDGHFPPMSSGPRNKSIDGPDSSGNLEFEGRDREHIFIPVAVLVNHLRLAGWIVIPPEIEK
jgi:hypothetical protein